jgi:hypothetical protein
LGMGGYGVNTPLPLPLFSHSRNASEWVGMGRNGCHFAPAVTSTCEPEVTENEKLLNILVLAAETVFARIVTETQTTSPVALTQAHKWRLMPGSRVELRVDLGGLEIPASITTVRCVIVDSGDEPLWQLFPGASPSDIAAVLEDEGSTRGAR